jgi:hypothetical protein
LETRCIKPEKIMIVRHFVFTAVLAAPHIVLAASGDETTFGPFRTGFWQAQSSGSKPNGLCDPTQARVKFEGARRFSSTARQPELFLSSPPQNYTKTGENTFSSTDGYLRYSWERSNDGNAVRATKIEIAVDEAPKGLLLTERQRFAEKLYDQETAVLNSHVYHFCRPTELTAQGPDVTGAVPVTERCSFFGLWCGQSRPAESELDQTSYSKICQTDWRTCKGKFVIFQGKVTQILGKTVVRVATTGHGFDVAMKQPPRSELVGAEIKFSGYLENKSSLYDDISEGEVVAVVRSAAEVKAEIAAKEGSMRETCLAQQATDRAASGDASRGLNPGTIKRAMEKGRIEYDSFKRPFIYACVTAKDGRGHVAACEFAKEDDARPTFQIYPWEAGRISCTSFGS